MSLFVPEGDEVEGTDHFLVSRDFLESLLPSPHCESKKFMLWGSD